MELDPEDIKSDEEKHSDISPGWVDEDFMWVGNVEKPGFLTTKPDINMANRRAIENLAARYGGVNIQISYAYDTRTEAIHNDESLYGIYIRYNNLPDVEREQNLQKRIAKQLGRQKQRLPSSQ